MKKSYTIIAMTGICILLGFIIGIQAKSVKRQADYHDLQRVSELSAELKKINEINEDLVDKIKEYETKISEFENSLANEDASFKVLREEVQGLKTMAGLTEVEGRGVIVTLEDSPKSGNTQGTDINAFLVHSEDLLSVINELNVAGAEAVSINGQRIIGSSSIRCAGSIVNVNGVKIAAPFEIKAIGDPAVLESALTFPGGVVDSLSPWGISVNIKESQTVVIPGYNQTIKFIEAVETTKEESR